MAAFKILVTDTLYPSLEPEKNMLAIINADTVLASAVDSASLIREGRDCDGMMVEFADINEQVIAGLDKCKIIVRTAIGYDNIDVKAASAKNIMVANIPDYCVEEVSEHALALLLTCARKVVYFNSKVKAGVWDAEAGGPIRRMSTRTLGLVGFGNIARRFAVKAKPLGMRIMAYDPFLPDAVFIETGVERIKTLEELVPAVDYLSLHIPFKPENKNIVNDALLASMKSTAYLINTSRGGLVDIDALHRALQLGTIAGAMLDVMPVEPPPPDLPLLQLDNLIVTPHCGYYSEDSTDEIRRKAAEQIIQALTEGRPRYLVNP